MLNTPTQKPIVAAFDFDGTITTRDSLLPFLFYTTGRMKTLKKLFFLLPTFVKYLIGLASRQETKENVLRNFFNGTPASYVLTLGKLFALSSTMNDLIRPEAKERIDWHLRQGHRCILISANLDVYLNSWGKFHGFQDVIASRLKVDKAGHIDGHLDGLNCWGPEKQRRLDELMGPRQEYTLYAYGDSRGDQELLAGADYAFYRRMKEDR